MKGLDTNVLVRYLVQDDPVQSDTATREIESISGNDETFIICPVVLCELVWVLDFSYKISRANIAESLANILITAQFEVLEKDIIWLALNDYRTGSGDFADYYIGIKNHHSGAETTITFDRGLKPSSYFKLLH